MHKARWSVATCAVVLAVAWGQGDAAADSRGFRITPKHLGFFPKGGLEEVQHNFVKFIVPPLGRVFPNHQRFSVRVGDGLSVNAVLFTRKGRGTHPRKVIAEIVGNHGPEALVGHVMQRFFAEEIVGQLRNDPRLHGVVVFDVLNPWGLKHGRRVTENNVDLNRNAGPDTLYQTRNPIYDALGRLMNPPGKAGWQSWTEPTFLFQCARAIQKFGMDGAEQAMAGGQWNHPQGLFYGGRAAEPQIKWLTDTVWPAVGESCDDLLVVDRHTGYGWGGQLYVPSMLEGPSRKATRATLRDLGVDRLGDDPGIMYDPNGAVVDDSSLALPNKRVVPVTYEMGTRFSGLGPLEPLARHLQKTLGVDMGRLYALTRNLMTLQIVRLENQGWQNGYKTGSDRVKIVQEFWKLFYPSSIDWRLWIMQQNAVTMPVIVENFLGVE